VQIQGLVAKLQKTQRAAEQALDKFVSFVNIIGLLAGNSRIFFVQV